MERMQKTSQHLMKKKQWSSGQLWNKNYNNNAAWIKEVAKNKKKS